MSYSGELSLIGLAASSFVATNTDNLLLLVLLQGAFPRKKFAVLLGFLSAVLLVVLVSLLGIAVGRVLDAGLVGYFGLVPIGLGLHMLYSGSKRPSVEGAESGEAMIAPGAGPLIATLVLMLANSTDSLLVLMPLLADTNPAGELTLITSYLLCAVLWSGLAWKIGQQRSLAVTVERWGVKVVPWIVIAVGLYIFLDTATDGL
ncbi:hypothetical protein EY643_15330 [Halioglobus maricola]|uniref:Cadmium transporter n=1 Tax=Halioglobus maricola TaxID=2601894 RepID=A0A5P9NMD6_9GAMM|nr:cadmium resistance transporter [Halioglobus maricola]QFU76912.1 hypothetical protein EY643_15330 [Halioglobus maricola]